MKNEMLPEFASAAILILVAVLLLNPFEFWMPTSTHMVLLAAAVVAFGVLAVFVLRERGGDERESEHRSFAGRAAFLAGSAVLLTGILVQSLAHTLDPWLVAGLLGMVGAKTTARLYSAWYR